jgi:hypothetical protein
MERPRYMNTPGILSYVSHLLLAAGLMLTASTSALATANASAGLANSPQGR